MMGITPLHLVIVLVIALIVLGPGKLPEVGAAMGKSIREFRNAATDVQEAIRIDPAPAVPTNSAPTLTTPAVTIQEPSSKQASS